jgi:hypothetical protein
MLWMSLDGLGGNGPGSGAFGVGLGWPPFLQFAVDESGTSAHQGDELRGGYLVPAGLGGVEQFVSHRQGGFA